MRDDVVTELIERAATDPGFRSRARDNLDAALAEAGIVLEPDELEAARALHARLAGLDDGELTRALGARGRQGAL